MVYISRWKTVLILAMCLLGILYALPNVLNERGGKWAAENLPSWAPTKTVNLGLDLQGGAHLLYAVDIDDVLKEQGDTLLSSLRSALREEKISYTSLEKINNGVRITLTTPETVKKVRNLLRSTDRRLEVTSNKEGVVSAVLSDKAIEEIVSKTISQSIEVIRRRVDETGTREPVIQRQGDDRVLVQLPGIKDPSHIKELIGKTAKLTFHLVIGNDQSGKGGVLRPLSDAPEHKLRIMRRPTLTGDMLTGASPSFNQFGEPVVTFSLNSLGKRRFCTLTRQHTHEPFAIVLDGKILSAPNINQPICGGSAQISGSFTVEETADLSLLLRAGALPADLKILEERTVGPSLGADSVAAGKNAALAGLVFVLFFMALSYGLFGWFANIALAVNVFLIIAALSVLQATLTLPGIAGIVLTMGMAVDANVLIFERIREETALGRSVINAIEAGYSKAMSTIVDSNLTTLIAALILYSFGTGPIKGFAVTLGIGIITSFFSAIMVTRLLVVTWLRKKRPSRIPV